METSGKPEFLFNAMLMFGWVADKDSRITEVNVALESWLAKTDEGKYLVEEIKKGRGPLVEEFFRKIMDTSDDGSIEEFNTVTQHLRDIPESMALASLPESSRSEVRRVRVETEFIPTWDGEYLLIGVRAVRVGGFFLKGGNLKDRFDLIIVCQTKRAGGRWVVSGYQGQLQNAWLRVEPIVREGTRAGAVALMGRSLSHNIGSHALYWMEQDARKWSELGATTKPDFGDSLSTLFRYLRE